MSDDPRYSNPDIFVFYRYKVSVPAAAIFIALFSLSTIYHCYQLQRTKRWIMIPMIIGGLMQVGGYAARIESSKDQWAMGPYIAQTLLLLVAPVLFAATVYMTLSGIVITGIATSLANQNAKASVPPSSHSVEGLDPQYQQHDDDAATLTSPQLKPADVRAAMSAKVLKIPVAWITRIFVAADIVSLVTQGGGGGIMAGGGEKSMETGETIVLVGLWVQIVAFVFFIFIGVMFHLRQRKVERASNAARSAKKEGWKKMLYGLYVASALILVRNLFRVIEYIQGNAGYLMRNEFWLYIFDAMLMFLLIAIFNVAHPGQLLVTDWKKLAKEGGDEEIEMGNASNTEGWSQVN